MCNKNQDVHLSSSLPLQYFFSAKDVKSRIYPSLDAIFFSPSCFITAAWTAANSNCTFALRCLGLCCTFDLTRLFNVGNWADSLKLQTGDCTPQDANTSHLTAVSLHRMISLTSGRGNTANYETLLALSTCGLIWKLHLLFGSGGILLTMPRKHLWNILHIAAALLVISFPFIYKLELSKQLLRCWPSLQSCTLYMSNNIYKFIRWTMVVFKYWFSNHELRWQYPLETKSINFISIKCF